MNYDEEQEWRWVQEQKGIDLERRNELLENGYVELSESEYGEVCRKHDSISMDLHHGDAFVLEDFVDYEWSDGMPRRKTCVFYNPTIAEEIALRASLPEQSTEQPRPKRMKL